MTGPPWIGRDDGTKNRNRSAPQPKIDCLNNSCELKGWLGGLASMVNNAVFAPFTDSAVVQGGVGSALPAPRPQSE